MAYEEGGMDRFKDRFVIVAVFATLGLVGMFMSAHHVTAAPPPPPGPTVTIGGPLPLPVSGTIGLQPDASLLVSNPATNPVLVRDVDRSGLTPTPFQTRVLCPNANGTACIGSFNVPSDQRLLIQYVSAECFFGADTRLWRVQLETTVNATIADHSLTVLDHAGSWMGNIFNAINTQAVTIGQQATISADAGTVIRVFGQVHPASLGDQISCGINLSGQSLKVQ